jgi:hypothetical protein
LAELPISELKGSHKGLDIFVVASGASAGFIEPEFFNNKIAIGVNESWVRFPNLDYLVRKETERSEGAYQSGIPLIVSRFNCGLLGSARNQFYGDKDYYYFEHQNNGIETVDISILGSDKIIVSYSTITSAMHVAAYMGAENILLIGHDCGTLDGKLRMDGLPEAIAGDEFYRRFITEIEPQSIQVRKALEDFYQCRIYSINPFLNFGLEGHEYHR